MAYSHSQLVDRFKEGKVKGRSSSMFIEGDTLYSYGHHFPLLERMQHWGEDKFLLNADRYSVTTSGHQSNCSGVATVQIPFSALEMALIHPEQTSRGVSWGRGGYDLGRRVLEDLYLIDQSEMRWDKTGKWWYRCGEATHGKKMVFGREQTVYHRNPMKLISNVEYEALPDAEKEKCHEQEERRPESCVLMYKGRYFLSSMDENAYFICELPCPCDTVDAAFLALKPCEVCGKKYQRQGEWFFVDLGLEGKVAKRVYDMMQKDYVLPKERADSNDHTATRGTVGLEKLVIGGETVLEVPRDTILVSGQVRHPEHRRMSLSTLKDVRIFAAYENNALGSWSATNAAGGRGGVD
jgi:hypothetical protein